MVDRTPSPTAPGPSAPRVYLACALLMLVILALDLALPLGVVTGIPYVVAVLVSLWAPARRVTLVVAVVSSVLVFAAFFHKPPGLETWQAAINRGLTVGTVAVTAWLGLQLRSIDERRRQALREREEALARVRVLSGLLPICASCKRIRDQQGSWTQIESYVRAHSEADFSHGICPECAVKLYPEFYNKSDGDGGSGA